MRPKDHSLGGLWEFPGGKIETGESPEAALARELVEELDIEVEVGELKYATTHSYGNTHVLLLFYEITQWRRDPQALHHSELRWVDDKEFSVLAIPEANRKVIDHLVGFI